MDICLNVPHVSNRMDCTDETIPFLQMVMSGYVQYCGFPLNAEGNTKEAVLRSSSVAAGLNFVLSAQNAEEFRSVEPFDMYSTDFDFWLDKVVEITGEYQKKLAEYVKPEKGQSKDDAFRSSWVTRFRDKTSYNLFKSMYYDLPIVYDVTADWNLTWGGSTAFAARVDQIFNGTTTPGTMVETYADVAQTEVNDLFAGLEWTGNK